jgi:hypothetical protein
VVYNPVVITIESSSPRFSSPQDVQLPRYLACKSPSVHRNKKESGQKGDGISI